MGQRQYTLTHCAFNLFHSLYETDTKECNDPARDNFEEEEWVNSFFPAKHANSCGPSNFALKQCGMNVVVSCCEDSETNEVSHKK